jgi:glycosyltransferase involved in cell wall biosynthesis
MDLAVDACARLVRAGHTHIHWWIVGGGPAESEVRGKIRQLGMERYVTMLGMKDNPYPYIAKADLYVQPSRFEGYPLSILEALILGKPVVSTDNGGAGEILQPEVTGLLCPISSEGIAEAVEHFLMEPTLLHTMQKAVVELNFEEQNRYNVEKLEQFMDA